jgi:hypothetical protein
MHTSTTHEKNAQEFVADLDTDHYQLLRQMTVRLYGIVTNGGLFTGTGVIIGTKDDGAPKTYILTAKHNLYVASKKANLPKTQLADYFKQRVQVYLYHGKDNQQRVAPISNVSFYDSVDDFKYDVCLLTVTDAQFTRTVRGLLSRDFTNYFRPKSQDPQFEWATGCLDAYTLSRRLLGASESWSEEKLMDYVLLQFGYGENRSGAPGFQYRLIDLSSLDRRSSTGAQFLEKTHEGYENVFVFPTDDDNTALVGDSGGPVFLVQKNGLRSWLVGVHLGANFYKAKLDTEDKTENNAFSVIDNDTFEKLLGDAPEEGTML